MSLQVTTDNEYELDMSRNTGGNQSDDGRQQQTTNYVPNRISIHGEFRRRRKISIKLNSIFQ